MIQLAIVVEDKVVRDATRFDLLTSETIKFVEDAEVFAGAPCSMIGNWFD